MALSGTCGITPAQGDEIVALLKSIDESLKSLVAESDGLARAYVLEERIRRVREHSDEPVNRMPASIEDAENP